MSVALLDIAFNHEAASAARDAITVRQNAAQVAVVPEWRAAAAAAGLSSSVCYARDALGAAPIAIRLRLARRDPTLSSADIRAIDLPSSPLPPWLVATPPLFPPVPLPVWLHWYRVNLFLWMSGIAPEPAPATSQPGVLGSVSPRTVVFRPDGQTDATIFELTGSLQGRGVGVYPVRWQWQFRRSAQDPWTSFATSTHRVYLVLDVPTLPWVQAPVHPANTQLPWLDVLDVACRWATGAQTRDEAAARVTRAVHDLGGRVIEYDCLGPGAALFGTPHYTLFPGLFDCSEFLERLRGGAGLDRFVNCSDCAAIVSTFANVLGCDLSQSRMAAPFPFPLNPTRSIGSTVFQSACGAGSFTVHEVAWAGACGVADDLYDACLEVDDDLDPTRPPHVPRLPVGVRFGLPGDGQYGDRLVAPAGRLQCQPRPLTRQRRAVI